MEVERAVLVRVTTYNIKLNIRSPVGTLGVIQTVSLSEEKRGLLLSDLTSLLSSVKLSSQKREERREKRDAININMNYCCCDWRVLAGGAGL